MTNSTAWSLEIDDRQNSVPNPTEADLRKSLVSLKDDETPYNLIVIKGLQGGHWVQVNCMGKDAYLLQIQEGDERHQYQATKNLSAEGTMKLLIAFIHGDTDWKRVAEWKPL